MLTSHSHLELTYLPIPKHGFIAGFEAGGEDGAVEWPAGTFPDLLLSGLPSDFSALA